MATFVAQKQDMTAGESRYIEEAGVTLPAGLTNVQIELDLDTNELRDPTTHVRADLEWLNPGRNAWQMINSVTLIGHPDNEVRTIPYIRLSAQDCAFFAGHKLRGKIVAASAGRYGATVRAE